MSAAALDERMSPAVLRYYLYKATRAVELYRPVMYLYFVSVGLSFTQIALLEAAYNVTTVVAEVPTGYVGDVIGRRLSLVVGTAVIATTLAGIAFATTFPALLALYVLWSVGYAFRSGSEDAWLYDSLVGDGEFATVRGRGESVALAVGVGGAVVGGWLAGVDLTYPFLVAAVVTGVGAAVLLTVDDPADADESFDPLTPRRALEAVRTALSDARLRSFVPYYYVLFSAVTYLVFIFLQPRIEAVAAEGTVAAVVGAAGGVEPFLGWYYAGISLVGAVLTGRAGWIRETVGVGTWFLATPFAVAALLVGQWAVPLFALPAFLLVRGVSEASSVFAATYVNDRVASLGRATTLSALAMVSGLTVVPFQLAGGGLSDRFSPGVALGVAGVVLAVGSLALIAWRVPVPRSFGTEAPRPRSEAAARTHHGGGAARRSRRTASEAGRPAVRSYSSSSSASSPAAASSASAGTPCSCPSSKLTVYVASPNIVSITCVTVPVSPSYSLCTSCRTTLSSFSNSVMSRRSARRYKRSLKRHRDREAGPRRAPLARSPPSPRSPVAAARRRYRAAPTRSAQTPPATRATTAPTSAAAAHAVASASSRDATPTGSAPTAAVPAAPAARPATALATTATAAAAAATNGSHGVIRRRATRRDRVPVPRRPSTRSAAIAVGETPAADGPPPAPPGRLSVRSASDDDIDPTWCAPGLKLCSRSEERNYLTRPRRGSRRRRRRRRRGVSAR